MDEQLADKIKHGHYCANLADSISIMPTHWPGLEYLKLSPRTFSYSNTVFKIATDLLSENSREEIDKSFDLYLNKSRESLIPQDLLGQWSYDQTVPDHRDLRFQATFKLALDILAIYEVNNCDNNLLKRYLDFYYELTS